MTVDGVMDVGALADDATALADMFAEVFDLESASVDDDFFRLGGDSLTGTSLLNAIEKRLGIVFSLSILLEAPTPRALAKIIAERSAPRAANCLVAINTQGEAPAIFCVHGTGGQSMAPLRLSSVISRPFYAFRALGLEESEDVLLDADPIASAYIGNIEAIRPEGSRIILGHCAGATIAYAIAQQLARAGKPAAGLILIDPETGLEWAPFLYKSGLQLKMALTLWDKRRALLQASIDNKERLSGDERRDLVFHSLRHAAATYMPAPYDGPVLLLSSPERREALLNEQRGYPTLIKDLTFVGLDVIHERMFSDGMAQVSAAVSSFVKRVSGESA